MNVPMKPIGLPVLLLILALLQVNPAFARSDDVIKREIVALIAGSDELRGTRIEVRVEQRLVVLTSEVRLYEQKLISDRMS